MRLDSEESLVLRWAAMSRLAVWLVGALSHALITPYDRSAALPSSLGAAGASAPAEAAAVVAGPPPLLDGAVDALIAPFANWDGVYFVRIAEAGYVFEQFHAFFPLLPLAMRAVRAAASSLASLPLAALGLPPLLSARSALLVAGFGVTNACFVLAAWALLWLGRYVNQEALRDATAKHSVATALPPPPPPHPRALLAALLFCVGPSGVFFSALYTEAPFAALSFGGMLALARARAAYAHARAHAHAHSHAHSHAHAHAHNGDEVEAWAAYGRWRLCAAGCFALAATARSNGVLLLLLLAYDSAAQSPPLSLSLSQASGGRGQEQGRGRGWLAHWLHTLVLGVLGAIPWCCVHVYGWARYCYSSHSHGDPTATPPVRPWCSARGLGGLLPPQLSLYGFVQREYWNVGAFRYYEVKQIPNFLLAAPMAALSASGIVAAARVLRDRVAVRARAGAMAEAEAGTGDGDDAGDRDAGDGTGVCVPPSAAAYLRSALQEPLVALTLQWAALLTLGLVVVHVQVLTRFLSACPQVYWHAAALVARDDGGAKSEKPIADRAPGGGRGERAWIWWRRLRLRAARTATAPLVLGYFVLYGHVLGPILFCNFYPWT